VSTNVVVFVLAAFLEIAGCFAFWLWLRRGVSFPVAVVGTLSLVAFALTRVDAAFAGRAYAAYGGLATGAIAHQKATGKVRRNMPEPIPVMVIGRLAVDREHQGKGLGSALLKDALLRTLNAASIAGIRAVLLHAISEDATRFYEKAGFSASPVDPMTMMITLADFEKALGGR
jgi:drug/metabolite transporter superfamily protein YnfA